VSDHLSALQLDEIVAGLAPPPEHLAGCAECTARVEVLRKESAAFLARPEAKAQLAQLLPAPPRRSFLRVLAVAVALAAGLAIFLAWPKAPVEDRIKGAPTVVLLDVAGNAVTHAAPGTTLTLAVGSGGFPRVRVFAVDAQGKKEPLFAGPVAAGARVPLRQLEVTPGDVTVTAEFESDTEQQSASVRLAVP
jgi:hypothetical protein